MIVTAVTFGIAVALVIFVAGGRVGAWLAREDAREWAAMLYRVRSLGGKCPTCGNPRGPEPLP